MSVTGPAAEARVEATRRWCASKGSTRIFDVSKPWLNRVLEGGGRVDC